MKLSIIHEDNKLLVLNKTPGLIVEKNPFESPTVETLVEEYLHNPKKKAYVGVIHRLDRVTSGVLIFAKKKSTLKLWNEYFREKLIKKTYIGLTDKALPKEKGTLKNWLIKDQKNKISISVPFKKKDAKLCSLEYELVEEKNNTFKYEIKPITGKFHQIRVQFSEAGAPLRGDIKYGGSKHKERKIALHASRLICDKEEVNFTAPELINPYFVL